MFEESVVVWMFVIEDKKEVVVFYVEVLRSLNLLVRYLKFDGFDFDKKYFIESEVIIKYGDEFMNIGIFIF